MKNFLLIKTFAKSTIFAMVSEVQMTLILKETKYTHSSKYTYGLSHQGLTLGRGKL